MHKNENHLYLNKTAIKNPICKAGKKIKLKISYKKQISILFLSYLYNIKNIILIYYLQNYYRKKLSRPQDFQFAFVNLNNP